MRLWQLQGAMLAFLVGLTFLAKQMQPPRLPPQYTKTCANPADPITAEACASFRQP